MLFLPNFGPFIVAMIISDWITVKTAVLMASKKAAPAAKTSVTALAFEANYSDREYNLTWK
jgi:hypothetical protein